MRVIVDTRELRDLRLKLQEAQKQLPYAQARALNEFGMAAMRGLRAVIPNYLDNPVSYTLRAPQVKKATKRDLVMAIFLRDDARGGGHLDYMRALVEGGQDKPKASERLLKNKSLMADRERGITARSLRNRYGNLAGGGSLYRRVLAEVEPLQELPRGQRHRGTMHRKGDAPRAKYFVGRPGNGTQPLGVWKRDGKRGLRPILLFGREAPTRRQFPFYTFVLRLFDRSFSLYMRRALDEAFRAAR